jgi:hypothetical protein
MIEVAGYPDQAAAVLAYMTGSRCCAPGVSSWRSTR